MKINPYNHAKNKKEVAIFMITMFKNRWKVEF